MTVSKTSILPGIRHVRGIESQPSFSIFTSIYHFFRLDPGRLARHDYKLAILIFFLAAGVGKGNERRRGEMGSLMHLNIL